MGNSSSSSCRMEYFPGLLKRIYVKEKMSGKFQLSKNAKAVLWGFLAILVFSIAGLGTYAALHKRKNAPIVELLSFLNAPSINRSSLVGTTGTWSLNTTINALQLNWTSNSQLYTVWDSSNGYCGPNSVSYALLSNTNWFDSQNFVPFGLGFPTSYTVLATTDVFTDPLTTLNYAFKLVLYQGMLRIERDGGSSAFWNNYQGISSPTPLPSSAWPSTQDDGSRVLWKIGDLINSTQFRSNGEFLVGSGINPFQNPNGFGSWFAHTYSSLTNQC